MSTRVLCTNILLIGVALSFFSSNGTAASPTPKPPTVDVRSYVLMDYHSGQVLAEVNADERADPASLTKLMTAYVVFQELHTGKIQLSDNISVSEKAWRTSGSRTFIKVGTAVAAEALLKGMIIQSGNDASVALAEYVAGTEEAFADLMNRTGQRLGMSGTHFVNSTGLPHPEHYTTARDVALLLRAIIRDFPAYYAWYSEREFTYNGITQYNRNRLLGRDPSVDGGKTGYTESAGYCLATSAQRDGMRLISVVLGAKREKVRVDASQALLNYGFRFFTTQKLHEGNTALAEVRIWKGAATTLPLGLSQDLYATIPRGQEQHLSTAMNIQPYIQAPATQGASYGTVNVMLAEASIGEYPLIALAEVPAGGWWRRAVDQVILFIYSLFTWFSKTA
jgi:D-alanyl-D-alanine carboxypeptidase (penicillin-binding protein 5/6)